MIRHRGCRLLVFSAIRFRRVKKTKINLVMSEIMLTFAVPK